ncbi:winged helix DNA-binding domain-containing protein [Subtercola sp. YIM 133946]|uniref:winged helix DNA-binding domain-containing protein n=1 Tax=Subtercola sp. YIM 133946 TaxID=3118909 RepID=UPI002F92A36B
MKPTDRSRLARLRLASQRIGSGDETTAAELVRWMTASQAQDLPGAKWSVALRSAGLTAADVDVALDRGEFVRSWPFRGTLHFVAGEDLGWMLDLTATRTIAGAASRHRGLGLDTATFDAARAIAEKALAGGTALTRDELFAAFQANGVATDGQRGAHLLWYLSHTKVLCFGPMVGRQQALVLLDEWVGHPRRLDRDESLGELVLRYMRSHGPATLKDFLWWSKVLVPEARAGLELARGELESIDVDGATYWLAAGSLDADLDADTATARSSVHLLPGFDEYLLGYTDRGAALDAGHFERIVPGSNGMFLPTIVAGGRVVGTWSRKAGPKKVTVTADAFGELTAAQRSGFAAGAARYADYLGLPLG